MISGSSYLKLFLFPGKTLNLQVSAVLAFVHVCVCTCVSLNKIPSLNLIITRMLLS